MTDDSIYYITIISVIVIFILIIVIAVIRNRIVVKLKTVEKNKSLVDVYLKKRYDLIPNLVEVCKGYAKFEKETLSKIIELRSLFNNNPNNNNENNLKTEYQRLIVLAEKYPDIKADQSFLNLQKQIVNVENELQAARRIYINSITKYNNEVLKLPTSILAKIMGYNPIDLPKFDYDEIKVHF